MFQKYCNSIKYLSTVLSVVFGLFFMLLVLIMGYSLYYNDWNGSETYYFGYKPVIVVSGSMEPAIKTNSVLIINKCDNIDDIVVGDVIVYKGIKGIMVTHRVIDVTNEGLITKGDNNSGKDRYLVTNIEIRAKVVKIYNGVSGFITLLFGDILNISVYRLLLGFVILSLLISYCYIMLKCVYDYIVINYFINKQKDLLLFFMHWDKYRIDHDKLDNIRRLEGVGFLKRLLIYYYRMKIYNRLCKEEYDVVKTFKIYEKVLLLLKR